MRTFDKINGLKSLFLIEKLGFKGQLLGYLEQPFIDHFTPQFFKAGLSISL